MKYKLNTWAGDNFSTVALKAKALATKENITVEFDFNGCICLVNSNTDTNLLSRDYTNHWTMGWDMVGPNCEKKYSKEVQSELDEKTKAKEAKDELERIEYRKKEDAERLSFSEKVRGIEIELLDSESWAIGKNANKDAYGSCVYEYAESWAKLMQVEVSNGNQLKDIAETTSHELSFLGITGVMYGAAVSILSQCWKHGESLRKWHNKEYKHEGEGVVNPAILNINI